MTRLYYDDSYLREFRAEVVSVEGDRVYLNHSAFYPESGGQLPDHGTIAGLPVTGVLDEEDRVAHVVSGRLDAGQPVECLVDWPRRLDHMRQHTGQHLLSALLAEEHGVQTVSFHMGAERSTIDVDRGTLEAALLTRVEKRVNELVMENRAVTVSYRDSREDIGLRKATGREGTIRVVSIEGIDRSACGGTHVRSTGEIGPVLIRGLDKIRGIVRIEFVCGDRAVARARSDFDALTRAARTLSSALDDVPALVASQLERAAEAGKAHQRLALELAQLRGAELFRSIQPSPAGWRVAIRRIPGAGIEDSVRAEAQAFVSGGRAVFAAASESGAVLLAVSSDGPFQAGEKLKALFAAHGGRGGGNPQLAQGSAASLASREAILAGVAAGL
jgi:alanyl-tRNA synthetase